MSSTPHLNPNSAYSAYTFVHLVKWREVWEGSRGDARQLAGWLYRQLVRLPATPSLLTRSSSFRATAATTSHRLNLKLEEGSNQAQLLENVDLSHYKIIIRPMK